MEDKTKNMNETQKIGHEVAETASKVAAENARRSLEKQDAPLSAQVYAKIGAQDAALKAAEGPAIEKAEEVAASEEVKTLTDDEKRAKIETEAGIAAAEVAAKAAQQGVKDVFSSDLELGRRKLGAKTRFSGGRGSQFAEVGRGRRGSRSPGGVERHRVGGGSPGNLPRSDHEGVDVDPEWTIAHRRRRGWRFEGADGIKVRWVGHHPPPVGWYEDLELEHGRHIGRSVFEEGVPVVEPARRRRLPPGTPPVAPPRGGSSPPRSAFEVANTEYEGQYDIHIEGTEPGAGELRPTVEPAATTDDTATPAAPPATATPAPPPPDVPPPPDPAVLAAAAAAAKAAAADKALRAAAAAVKIPPVPPEPLPNSPPIAQDAVDYRVSAGSMTRTQARNAGLDPDAAGQAAAEVARKVAEKETIKEIPPPPMEPPETPVQPPPDPYEISPMPPADSSLCEYKANATPRMCERKVACSELSKEAVKPGKEDVCTAREDCEFFPEVPSCAPRCETLKSQRSCENQTEIIPFDAEKDANNKSIKQGAATNAADAAAADDEAADNEELTMDDLSDDEKNPLVKLCRWNEAADPGDPKCTTAPKCENAENRSQCISWGQCDFATNDQFEGTQAVAAKKAQDQADAESGDEEAQKAEAEDKKNEDAKDPEEKDAEKEAEKEEQAKRHWLCVPHNKPVEDIPGFSKLNRLAELKVLKQLTTAAARGESPEEPRVRQRPMDDKMREAISGGPSWHCEIFPARETAKTPFLAVKLGTDYGIKPYTWEWRVAANEDAPAMYRAVAPNDKQFPYTMLFTKGEDEKSKKTFPDQAKQKEFDEFCENTKEGRKVKRCQDIAEKNARARMAAKTGVKDRGRAAAAAKAMARKNPPPPLPGEGAAGDTDASETNPPLNILSEEAAAADVTAAAAQATASHAAAVAGAQTAVAQALGGLPQTAAVEVGREEAHAVAVPAEFINPLDPHEAQLRAVVRRLRGAIKLGRAELAAASPTTPNHDSVSQDHDRSTSDEKLFAAFPFHSHAASSKRKLRSPLWRGIQHDQQRRVGVSTRTTSNIPKTGFLDVDVEKWMAEPPEKRFFRSERERSAEIWQSMVFGPHEDQREHASAFADEDPAGEAPADAGAAAGAAEGAPVNEPGQPQSKTGKALRRMGSATKALVGSTARVVGSGIGVAAEAVGGGVKDVAVGAATATKDAAVAAKNWAKSFPGKAQQAAKDAGDWTLQAGKNIGKFAGKVGMDAVKALGMDQALEV